MQVLYTNEYMATHSLTGAKSSTSRDKVVKPAMNQNEVQEIIGDHLIELCFHMTTFFIKTVIKSGHGGTSLSSQETEVGGPGAGCHSGCIAISLGCMRPYLKKKWMSNQK